MDIFDQKNRQFYDFLDQTFNLKRCKTWDQVAVEITTEKVMKTFKFFSKLFPRNVNYDQALGTKNVFRTIHYGNLKGNKIINEIVRFALYSDEILVLHPLQNPAITNPQLNPIKKTKYWLDDFLSALYFYIVLKKWVEAGIVKLIINPVHYDDKLKQEMYEKAKKRVSKFLEENRSSSETEMLDFLAEHFSHDFGNKPLEKIKESLLKIGTPKFTDKQAESFAVKIKEMYPKRNPLYKQLRIPRSNSIVSEKNGASVEEITYIMELSGGNIYTSSTHCWSMLKQLSVNEFWSKANHVLSKTELPFLNNVDTAFVLHLRKDGRLSQLRQEFKNLFSELKEINSAQMDERKIIELNQSFVHSLKSAEADWLKIKHEAENQRRYWATASVTLPIINHEMTIISLIGSAFWLANSLRGEKIQLTHFKNTNPLSVYIDLKHKDEGFFSELKSCLF